ncbi:MAG TPA: hypothetical protein VE549_02615 [Myxococcaceae bacterium]|nr:hypothetical protein [Myxococcaceae bacterium]
MIGAAEHPSFLELDAYALQGRGSIGAHVESCASCRRHVDTVRAPVETPDWVRSLKKRRSPFARWFPMLAGAGALATAGLAAFLLTRSPTDAPQTGRVTQKGAGPEVIVHVKRGERVSQWRAGERLRPGDVLRLEISPDGFRHVRVTATTLSGETVLFSGSLETHGPTLLPVGLQIDGASQTERLRIVLEDPTSTPTGISRRPWERTLTLEMEDPP